MTNTALKNQIDIDVTNKVTTSSITPTNVGDSIKLVVDYIDQQAPSKNSTAVTLSATQIPLPNDINTCNFTGGKAYLPTTEVIGKEVIVLAVSNNIEIFANVENTNKMFATYPTFTASIVLTTNQMYRFIYIGLGSGTCGVVDGYWKAELM